MEMESYENGVPSWVDHGSDDKEKAEEFYTALFGWEIEPGPPEAGGHDNARLRGKLVAGIGPNMSPGPAAWSTFINVDSADDTAAKVEAAGGKVLMGPMDVFDVGRMAVFMDPASAVFGVWQPGLVKGAQLANEPGAFTWNELITTDVEASKAFYGAVFGSGAETHGGPEGPPGGYTEWQLNGRTIGGMMPRPPTIPAKVPPFWGVYFAVPDTDAAVAQITDLGGNLVMPPTDIPQGRFAVAADPTGAVFNIIAVAS